MAITFSQEEWELLDDASVPQDDAGSFCTCIICRWDLHNSPKYLRWCPLFLYSPNVSFLSPRPSRWALLFYPIILSNVLWSTVLSHLERPEQKTSWISLTPIACLGVRIVPNSLMGPGLYLSFWEVCMTTSMASTSPLVQLKALCDGLCQVVMLFTCMNEGWFLKDLFPLFVMLHSLNSIACCVALGMCCLFTSIVFL